MFETKAVGDLVRIIDAGGGMEIRVGTKAVGDVVRMAEAAARSGARLYLRGCGTKAVGDLVRIAQAGRGQVVFADNLPE